MTAPLKSYRPEIKVYIDRTDRTELLGDVGTVRVQKSLYAPCAEVYVNFPDQPAAVMPFRDSLYGLVPVMAPIEIRMRRWHDEPATVGPWTTVLRGFVRSVGRDEQVGGDGRVQRQTTLVGQDCGAAFIMQQLNHLVSWQNSGLPVNTELGIWLREYGLVSQPYPAADFLWDLAQKSTETILSTAGFAFERKTTVKEGYVLPHTALTTEGPVWEMLNRYCDRPWNELFVREGENNPEFVYRPTPWKDLDGAPIGAESDLADVATWDIPMRNIVSLAAHRDDAELVNHVWVLTPQMNSADMVQARDLGGGLVNEETRTQFGDRVQPLPTYLGPTLPAHNNPEAQQIQAQGLWGQWVLARLEWAKRAGKNIHKFERGSLAIKGDPRIRVGDYIRVTRGPIVWIGYAVAVSHDFQPYRRYMTHIEYIRGDQWMKRLATENPWDRERQDGIALPL